nr:MAG: hypothetical protein [Microvirus sp.]
MESSKSSNGHSVPDYHPGGRKRLEQAISDYSLTMQHAIRQDLTAQLISRAKEEAGVLPEFTPLEMFDYLLDSDDEFINWCFPFCAYRLTKDNISHLHAKILTDFRVTLMPEQPIAEPSKSN